MNEYKHACLFRGIVQVGVVKGGWMREWALIYDSFTNVSFIFLVKSFCFQMWQVTAPPLTTMTIHDCHTTVDLKVSPGN